MFTSLLPAVSLRAQTNCDQGAGPLNKEQPRGATLQEVIDRFTANESAFRDAQMRYSFTMDVTVQTLEGETVTGEFRRVSEIHFEHGVKKEYVTFAPQSSLRSISLSKEDFEDIDRSPFILTREDVKLYNLMYVGTQHVDEIDTYVFDAAPKQIEKGKRYFQGRVWVDTTDKVVVKTCGKSVPDDIPQPTRKKKKQRGPIEENVTPTIVGYRELIDGKYWFPTYRRSDETLHFSTNDVRIKEIIKYTNFTPWNPQAGSSTAQLPPNK